MASYEFAVISDHGKLGSRQTDIANRLTIVAPDLLISCGDGVYADEDGAGVVTSTVLDNAWAAFSSFFSILVPAVGNHERDGDTNAAEFAAKFATQIATGSGKLYYRVYHAASRTGIYVMDTGYDTGRTQRQADGVGWQSVQGTWLRNTVMANTGSEDCKIMVMHHGAVGYAPTASKIFKGVDFQPERLGFDLVVHGHVHANAIVERAGCLHVCCGGAASNSRDKPINLYGNVSTAYRIYRGNEQTDGTSTPAILQITREDNDLRIYFVNVATGLVQGPTLLRRVIPKVT